MDESPSRKKLRDAFIELYSVKSINTISIKDITSLAGFNRGTFYIHYKDIYDLLEQIENDIVEDINQKAKDSLYFILYEQNFSKFLTQLEYISTNAKYFKALLGANGSPSFTNKLKTSLKENIRAEFATGKDTSEKTVEYIIEYIVSAQLGLITHWLETGFEIPAKEVALVISKIMASGPVNALQEALGVI
ncbi:MAG: TetR/AcrR family transcriptional regulator C-terminal domain-containing protein [Bacillota bacterium]